MSTVAADIPSAPRRRGATLLLRRVGLGVLGLLILLAIWTLLTYWLAGSTRLAAMLGPDETFHSLYQLLIDGRLTDDILVSLKRVLMSLVAALALGVPTGIAVGASKTLESTTSGAFQFLRMISPLSWMPIAVMAFGIGDAPIYFLLTITAIWPIILSTSAGVRQLDPNWLMLARSLGSNRRETLFHFIVPGILGHVLTGTRVAIGMIWILLIPCEMLGVSSGLGYFILDARNRLAYSQLMAVILVIGALGLILDFGAQWLRARLGGEDGTESAY